MNKVMLVFGTRPEAIKMCPLVRELKKSKTIKTVVCVTGQHRQMLEQVLESFDVRSDYDLSVMKDNQTLFDVTVNVLEKIKPVLESEKPDIVLVHGDTTTTFAASLACFYLHIKIGHVEAGLRTYDFSAPFPEEFNRRCTDLISSLYFAPTEKAKENLQKEGVADDKIFVTGNTAIDALKTTVKADYKNELTKWTEGSDLILLTAHRRENLGEPMRRMFSAIKRIVEEFNKVKVLYPVHLNPKVRAVAYDIFKEEERVKIIEPLEVADFHNLMARSRLILTDSGGIQEEAPSFGIPVLVMRDNTERPEGVEAGTLKLVGTEEERIYGEIKRLLTDKRAYAEMSNATNPYGDGFACERIKEILEQY